MIGNQRWRLRKAFFRRPDEQIKVSEYEVLAGLDHGTARSFVERHHYSGSWASSLWRFGLCRRGRLVGVANFGNAINDRAITKALSIDNARDGVELNRFVLLDEVAGNGETWFLGRCFRALRPEGLAGVISFSDPTARTDASGRVVFRGHLGVIYQAFNGVYLGRATPRTLKVLPDGTVYNDRKLSKVRTLDQGVDYCVGDLVRYGAQPPLGKGPEHLRAWLREWTGRLCRNVRHRGCHKYAWALSPAVRLRRSLPYPKGPRLVA